MKEQTSIIAISGKSGCGNSTVSSIVARKLSRRLINYTFHTMAQEMNIPFPELLVKAKNDYSFDKALDTKQIKMAHEEDCVIGSRLAIWLVKDACLKVYLYASSNVRAERVMQREGGKLNEVIAFTEARDKSDSSRYNEIYGIDNSHYEFADLIINTENLNPEQIADIIIAASEAVRA